MTHDKKQLVMGLHAVFEAVTHAPSSVKKIFLHDSPNKEKAQSQDILSLAKRHGIPIAWVHKGELDQMVGAPYHQGAAALVAYHNQKSLEDLLSAIPQEEPALIFMLDSLTDPQNVGAIFRLAEGVGASGLIWSKNRGCDLVPSLGKASCGASLLVPFSRVSNLASSFETLRDYDFYVGATDFDMDSHNPFEVPMPKRLCLILGSEGQGVRELLCKKADGKWHIPLKGKVQSLNVVQAATSFATLWRKSIY